MMAKLPDKQLVIHTLTLNLNQIELNDFKATPSASDWLAVYADMLLTAMQFRPEFVFFSPITSNTGAGLVSFEFSRVSLVDASVVFNDII
jgi:hypothetical protein